MKYYVPTIEEFHVGFEYQFKTLNGWEDKVVRWNDFPSYAGDYIGESLPNGIRVKYLDREDIEREGWKYGSWSYTEGSELIMTKANYNLFYSEQTRTLSITDSNRSVNEGGRYYHYQLFEGTIKNKSELRVLLKQLNLL